MKEKSKIPLLRRRSFRLLLVLLYALGAAAASGGGFVSLYLYNSRYYAADYETLCHELVNDLCADDMYTLKNKFLALRDEGYFEESTSEQLRERLMNGFMDGYHEDQTNFFFTIYDMEDNVLLSSYEAQPQASRVQVYDDVSYETVSKNMSWEEYDKFSFPPDAVDTSVQDYLIVSDEERELYGTESVTEAVALETPDINSLHDSQIMNDELGMLMTGYDEYNNFYVIRFNEDGTAYVETMEPAVLDESPQETYAHVTYTLEHSEPAYYITGCVRKDLLARDHYYNVRSIVYDRYQLRYAVPAVAAAGTLCMLICIILLLSQSGYAGNPEEPRGGVFERVPFDVFSAVVAVCAGSILLLAEALINNSASRLLELGVVAGCFFVWSMLFLWWAHTVTVRIRTGELFRNTLLFKIVRGLGHGIAWLGKLIWESITGLPGFWQVTLVLLGYLGLSLLCSVVQMWFFSAVMVLRILLWAATSVLLVLTARNLHLLHKGGRRLAEGDFETKIPEEKMFGRFREHAHDLNSLGDGMNKAVSDRLKSEMFRTELIANVSHDIRTPLTSIINYTDLLSKLDLEDEQAQEYIDVLSRQSARLRKLTEDVLEASKATTGSIKTDKQTMDLRILIEQMEGEYAEQFDAKHLQLVSSVSEEPLYVFADGRLLWRVMDNLFGNIRKYAMDGTRVYLNALREGESIYLLLRNISASQLGISADALMERFVQGDRSRNTEGSGLGLSIAQSLIALHDGHLELQIDGDLFKVTVTLPAAAPPEEVQN